MTIANMLILRLTLLTLISSSFENRVRSLDRDPVEENIPEVSEDYDGMMDALVDIQEKGDNMMAGIWWQKEILTKLENSLQEAEVKMEAAEERNEELDEAKYQLETEVLELETKREELMSRMSLDEQHIVRTEAQLHPLEEELKKKKTELGKLTLDLTSKKRQLETFQDELSSSSSKTTVGLNTTPMPILGLLALSLLFNIFVGIGLADRMITNESRKDIQSFGKNWIHKVLSLSHQRREKQNKRQTEAKPTKKATTKKNKETPIQINSENPSWSSDFFESFGISDFGDEWNGSHTNPLHSHF